MKRVLVTAPMLALLAGCQQRPPTDSETPSPSSSKPVRHEMAASTGTASALAELQALGDSGITGRIVFTEADGAVRVIGEVRGLAPSTAHGFHVHEKGDCSAPDGSSAGGHFNPTHKGHGDPGSAESHVGDLGNLTSDAKGTAQVSVVKQGATLGEGETSYLGKSVIVHTSPDDLKSQPTGNAGGRIACGVIQKQP